MAAPSPRTPLVTPFSVYLDISEKPLTVLLHLSCSQVVLIPALRDHLPKHQLVGWMHFRNSQIFIGWNSDLFHSAHV